jgi:hypothetical protein
MAHPCFAERRRTCLLQLVNDNPYNYWSFLLMRDMMMDATYKKTHMIIELHSSDQDYQDKCGKHLGSKII